MANYEFSPYIIDNIDFLHRLAKTKSDKVKEKLIAGANADQILSIVEICANILRSNFILDKKQKHKLAQYADFYRSIARSRTEETARKRIQQGGQLAVAALLAPILSEIAQHFLDKTFFHS